MRSVVFTVKNRCLTRLPFILISFFYCTQQCRTSQNNTELYFLLFSFYGLLFDRYSFYWSYYRSFLYFSSWIPNLNINDHGNASRDRTRCSFVHHSRFKFKISNVVVWNFWNDCHFFGFWSVVAILNLVYYNDRQT